MLKKYIKYLNRIEFIFLTSFDVRGAKYLSLLRCLVRKNCSFPYEIFDSFSHMDTEKEGNFLMRTFTPYLLLIAEERRANAIT